MTSVSRSAGRTTPPCMKATSTPDCGIAQQALVLVGAAGHALLDRHAVARQDFLVALRVLVVHAVRQAGGENDVARYRALQQPGAEQGNDQQGGQQRQPVQDFEAAFVDLVERAHTAESAISAPMPQRVVQGCRPLRLLDALV